MIALVADALRSTHGVWRLLIGKPDFPSYFDVSPPGVIRSFGAMFLALPAYAFMFSAVGYALAELGQPRTADDPTFARAAALYAVVWLHFPIVAPLLARLAGRAEAAGAWIVVHNWTVLALIVAQSAIWAVYLAGVAGPSVPFQASWSIYLPLSLIVHWRVASQALSLPWGLSAGLACGHVLVSQMMQYLAAQAFAAPVAAGA